MVQKVCPKSLRSQHSTYAPKSIPKKVSDRVRILLVVLISSRKNSFWLLMSSKQIKRWTIKKVSARVRILLVNHSARFQWRRIRILRPCDPIYLQHQVIYAGHGSKSLWFKKFVVQKVCGYQVQKVSLPCILLTLIKKKSAHYTNACKNFKKTKQHIMKVTNFLVLVLVGIATISASAQTCEDSDLRLKILGTGYKNKNRLFR